MFTGSKVADILYSFTLRLESLHMVVRDYTRISYTSCALRTVVLSIGSPTTSTCDTPSRRYWAERASPR
jgi:hypothetical protein